VILSAGSIGSTQILLLSGVGPSAQLGEFGIPPVLHKPGVGENLQDHLQLRMIYKVSGVVTLNETYASPIGRAKIMLDYALFRRGPMTMAPSQLGIFTRSDPSRARANIQYHVQPLSLDRFGEPLHTVPAFTASVANVQPTSRGYVRLASPDPADKPAIQPNYLSTDDDRRVAVDSIRVTRRIVAQPALMPFKPVEHLPGLAIAPDDDEAALAKAAGDVGTTIFHPVGTARMGRETDAMAVVDERLRVHGLDRIRVVDASVMPTITSGNTNSPTMMIAEKGAAMIREDARRRLS
jgi:choline dehydrogenase-like flavoprotein